MQSNAVFESPGDTFVHFSAGALFGTFGDLLSSFEATVLQACGISCKSYKIGATVGICFVSQRQEPELLTNLSSFSIISSQVVS